MKLKVYKIDGADAGRTVEVGEDVLVEKPNDHAIWLDVRRIQASRRQGTHAAKERGQIRGSTRKLYRQKGTGHSRAGDVKSPLRRGGGTTFGPRPRSYDIKVNRKTQSLARRSAFSYKMRDDEVRVIEDFDYETPSAQDLAGVFRALELSERKVLLLTAGTKPALYRSGQNLQNAEVKEARRTSTLDLMHADIVLLQEGALDALHATLAGRAVEAAEAA